MKTLFLRSLIHIKDFLHWNKVNFSRSLKQNFNLLNLKKNELSAFSCISLNPSKAANQSIGRTCLFVIQKKTVTAPVGSSWSMLWICHDSGTSVYAHLGLRLLRLMCSALSRILLSFECKNSVYDELLYVGRSNVFDQSPCTGRNRREEGCT